MGALIAQESWSAVARTCKWPHVQSVARKRLGTYIKITRLDKTMTSRVGRRKWPSSFPLGEAALAQVAAAASTPRPLQ